MFQKTENVKKLHIYSKKDKKQVLGRLHEFLVVKIHFWWDTAKFTGAKIPLFAEKSQDPKEIMPKIDTF